MDRFGARSRNDGCLPSDRLTALVTAPNAAAPGEIQTVCGADCTGRARPDADARASALRRHAAGACRPGLPEVEITPWNAAEIRYHWCRHYGNHILSDVSRDDSGGRGFSAKAGGRAIVELTIEGIEPDPLGLRAIAQATGVAIIAGCGVYIESFAAEASTARSTDDLAALDDRRYP